ncbi:MAG TPA: winged helix-turn-helix domain-containing protein [Candidatus Thermoplasmatota archaeon]|nr:winged helix-turn-helix domain-containing protein [Candidatus Thermoplasmatota archaeon]
MRITLDAETFKALASPTRLTVLRALDERRKTLTEISRDLDLNKATVHEHLQLLAAADLVRKRDDEGRKWIYYELTWRGQKLLHPQETTTFSVLLGLGVAAAGGGLGLLAHSLASALEPQADAALKPEPQADRDALQKDGPQPSAAAASGSPSDSAGGQEAALRLAPGEPTPDAAPAGILDDGGALGLALLGFAALMALLAWLLRRHLRADPFRPPAEREEP